MSEVMSIERGTSNENYLGEELKAVEACPIRPNTRDLPCYSCLQFAVLILSSSLARFRP